jgi:hypothetical protein
MISHPCFRQVFLVLIGVTTTIQSLSARPLTFGDQKSQLSIPDDWVVQPMSSGGSGYAASATKPDKTESLSIFVVSTDSSGPLSDDSQYVKGLLKSCSDHNANVIGHESRQLKGIDFYVISVAQKLNSIELDSQIWLTVANSHIYQIAFYEKNGDPAKNADYALIIKSFSLTK